MEATRSLATRESPPVLRAADASAARSAADISANANLETDIQRWMAAHCAIVPYPLFAIVGLAGSSGLQVIVRHPSVAVTPGWVLDLCARAVRQGGSLSTACDGEDGATRHAVGLPVIANERLVGACVLVCGAHEPGPAEVEALTSSMGRLPLVVPSMVAASNDAAAIDPNTADLSTTDLSTTETATVGTAEMSQFVLRIVSVATDQPTLRDAAGAVSIALSTALRCDRVAVALFEAGSLRLIGSSDGFHTHAIGLRGDVLSAMEEALDDHGAFVYPVAPNSARLDAAHARLCNRVDLMAACTVTLSTQKQALGALLLTRDRGRPFSTHEVSVLEQVAQAIGPWLALQDRAGRSWRSRLVDALRARWNRKQQGRHVVLAAAVVVAAATVLGWPIRAEIVTPVKLEGAVQRVMASPGDNYIRKVAVRPGDTVKAGAVLLEFDVEDLRVERQRLLGTLAYNDAAAGDALAKNDSASLSQFQAKTEEAKAQLALIDQRLDRGVMTAPFDAVVIEGDLSNALGAPAKRGEKLMVLAPAHEFRAIVEIPDGDITSVHEGDAGAMVLTAIPDRTLSLRLKRIIPLATVADGRTYFEGEVELVDASPASMAALRPGMRGIARLEGGRQPRGLAWFDEARGWVRFAWWRWVG